MRTTVCCRLLALCCLAAVFRAIPACAPAPVACAPLVCIPAAQQAQPPRPPPQPAVADLNRRSGLPATHARAAAAPSTGLGPAVPPHCGALSAALGGTNPLLPGLVPLPAHELASITAAVLVMGLVAVYRYLTPAGSGSRASRLRRRQQQPQQSGVLKSAVQWLGGGQLASRIPDWRMFRLFLQCVLLVGAPVAGFLWPHMQWAVILAVVAQQAVYFLAGSALALAVATLHSLGLGIASCSRWLLYGEAPLAAAAPQPAAAAANTQRAASPAVTAKTASAAAIASSTSTSSSKARRSSKPAPARTLSAPIASSNAAQGEAAAAAPGATRSTPAPGAAVRRGRSLPSGFKVGAKQAATGTSKQQSPRTSDPSPAPACSAAPTTPATASTPKAATPSAAKQLRVGTPAARPAAQAPAATAPAAPKTVVVLSSSSPRGGSSPQPITPTTPKQLPTANPFAPARRQQGKVAAPAPAAHGQRPAARDATSAEGKHQPQAPRAPAQPQQPASRQLHICTTGCSKDPAPAVPAAPAPAAAKAPLQPRATSALSPPALAVAETRPLLAGPKPVDRPAVAAVDSPAYSLFSDAASPLEAALAQAAAAAAAGAAAGRPASPGTPFLHGHLVSAFAVQQQPSLLQPAVPWGQPTSHMPPPQLQAFVLGSWQRPPQQQLWQQQQLVDDERAAEQPPGWESMLLDLLADDGEAPAATGSSLVQLPSFSSVAGYSI